MLTALIAYFIWVIYDTAIKFGQQTPVSPFLVMAIVGYTGAIGLTAFAVFARVLPKLRPTRWREQGCTAVCAASITIGNIIAVKHLPLALYYVIFFTSPLIVAVLSAVLKHEILTPIKIACLVAGFFGTILAIGVHGGSGDIIGYLAIFVGIMGFSLRAIFVRHMGKTVTSESTQILCNLFAGTGGVLGFLLQPSGGGIGIMAFLIFAFAGTLTLLASLLYFRAIQNTVSTNVAQLQYTQVVFGALFGYIFWRDIPTWNLVVGSVIIIASGMFLASQARKTKNAVE